MRHLPFVSAIAVSIERDHVVMVARPIQPDEPSHLRRSLSSVFSHQYLDEIRMLQLEIVLLLIPPGARFLEVGGRTGRQALAWMPLWRGTAISSLEALNLFLAHRDGGSPSHPAGEHGASNAFNFFSACPAPVLPVREHSQDLVD
jgi:hypothetical protein